MKNIIAITLVLMLAFGLCACRMRDDQTDTPATQDANSPAATNPVQTDPIAEPTVMDPTMETNIPDPNVDNDHLIDPTGEDFIDDAARSITRRINGLS